MKITIIMPPFVWTPGGSNRVIYEYANHLASRKHSVTIVHPLVISVENDNNHRISRLKSSYLYWRRVISPSIPNWFPLSKQVNVIKVPTLSDTYIPNADIIVATQWFLAEQVNSYPRSKGEKFYLIHHHEGKGGYSLDSVEATWKLPMWKVTVSRLTYDEVSIVNNNRVYHIPNGIDHETYKLIQPIKLRPQRVAMSYVPKRIKDPVTGIRALHIAKERFPHLQVTLFGAGVRPTTIPNWIVYHQRQPDRFIVKEIYNQSSIFLCSSILEGFGFPPAEAMSCGCAVVSTDCGGIRDYAKHNINSLLSSPQDANALAENLCFLLQNDKFRIELATMGHEQIQDFNWFRSTDNLEQLMRISTQL
jgi:glycosyltransferase involved in cell wall biosynthesis